MIRVRCAKVGITEQPGIRHTYLRFFRAKNLGHLVDLPARLSQSYPLKNCALFWLFVLKEQCYSSIEFSGHLIT